MRTKISTTPKQQVPFFKTGCATPQVAHEGKRRRCPHGRGVSGQHLVELAAVLICCIPVFLLLFDVTVLILVNMANDSICRDAARAAASGRPVPFQSLPENWKSRALGVLQHTTTFGGYITQPPALVENESGPSNVVAPPASGGSYAGTVKVTTLVTTKLPAPLPGLPVAWSFKSRSEFPIVFQEKNTIAPPD